jgi:hypothetical protein
VPTIFLIESAQSRAAASARVWPLAGSGTGCSPKTADVSRRQSTELRVSECKSGFCNSQDPFTLNSLRPHRHLRRRRVPPRHLHLHLHLALLEGRDQRLLSGRRVLSRGIVGMFYPWSMVRLVLSGNATVRVDECYAGIPPTTSVFSQKQRHTPHHSKMQFWRGGKILHIAPQPL